MLPALLHLVARTCVAVFHMHLSVPWIARGVSIVVILLLGFMEGIR
jgi:hypothetical protein